jgi:hypothetical protein
MSPAQSRLVSFSVILNYRGAGDGEKNAADPARIPHAGFGSVVNNTPIWIVRDMGKRVLSGAADEGEK